MFGEDGAWRWVAPSGPPDSDGNWVSYSITMSEEHWRVFEGNFMAFERVFSNPKRLEIRASYNGLGNRTSLDNVRLFVRGDFATPVLPAITSFSAGIDGWSRNYPASEQIALGTEGDKNAQLIWNEFEGNPEGFLRIVENGGSAPDAFVVPDLYLGNYHGPYGSSASGIRCPPIEPERELVQIVIQMLMADRPLVRAQEPALEQRHDAMNLRHQL